MTLAARLSLPADLHRRAGAEAALLIGIGLFMAIIGPYGTDRIPTGIRHVYWQLCIVGGGVIGIGLDEVVRLRLRSSVRRVLATSLLMAPAVTLLVIGVGLMIDSDRLLPPSRLLLLWQVFVICLPIMAVRALVWRRPEKVVETQRVIETRTVVAPPLPQAEAAFRSRLSARRRAARLIALEAHDHYIRVHTDAGIELVTLRFADALAELAAAHGFRSHRSWWIAADAIEAVNWRRGAGEARLVGGVTAPVSRAHAPALKEAGWF